MFLLNNYKNNGKHNYTKRKNNLNSLYIIYFKEDKVLNIFLRKIYKNRPYYFNAFYCTCK